MANTDQPFMRYCHFHFISGNRCQLISKSMLKASFTEQIKLNCGGPKKLMPIITPSQPNVFLCYNRFTSNLSVFKDWP